MVGVVVFDHGDACRFWRDDRCWQTRIQSRNFRALYPLILGAALILSMWLAAAHFRPRAGLWRRSPVLVAVIMILSLIPAVAALAAGAILAAMTGVNYPSLTEGASPTVPYGVGNSARNPLRSPPPEASSTKNSSPKAYIQFAGFIPSLSGTSRPHRLNIGISIVIAAAIVTLYSGAVALTDTLQ